MVAKIRQDIRATGVFKRIAKMLGAEGHEDQHHASGVKSGQEGQTFPENCRC